MRGCVGWGWVEWGGRVGMEPLELVEGKEEINGSDGHVGIDGT